MTVTLTDYQCEFEVIIEQDRGAFLAFVPALPEINTYGDTLDHALKTATEAIELSLEYRRANGLPVPSGRARQVHMVPVPLPVIS